MRRIEWLLEAWKQEGANSKLTQSQGFKDGLVSLGFTDMSQWWAGILSNGIWNGGLLWSLDMSLLSFGGTFVQQTWPHACTWVFENKHLSTQFHTLHPKYRPFPRGLGSYYSLFTAPTVVVAMCSGVYPVTWLSQVTCSYLILRLP